MSDAPPKGRSPAQVFQAVRYSHRLFLAVPLISIGMAELFLLSNREFRGYAGLTPREAADLTAAFYSLGLAAVVAVLFLRRWYFLPARFTHAKGLTGDAVAHRLQRAQFLVFTAGEAPAVLGLVHFAVAGQRPPLYSLVALGLLAMVLARPVGSQWSQLFDQLALAHPDVSPLPWD